MRPQRSWSVPLALVWAIAMAPVSATSSDDDVRAVIVQALRDAGDIPSQARALADLAWPIDLDSVDPAVRAEARSELVGFGRHGTEAIRTVINERPSRSEDAVSAMIEIRSSMASGLPPSYLATLDEALWFGSTGARRLAMEELGRMRTARNMLAIIDCAEEEPELVPLAIDTLAKLRNDRARFWLATFLNGDDSELRNMAAEALAVIGARALTPLKEGLASDRSELRTTCARVLAQVAGFEDLTALYEYLADHSDDDPATVEAVRARALAIEQAMAEWEREQDELDPADDGRP